ncbi:type I secretion system permease/ATPase [Aeromonas caviae]|uniref:type I secretion system permease/ATPase n=1 Tax=Aeromonas caviae TaxID=648 RepID=UPI001F3FBCDD|nr:type I secretion system permease/ATPase [Aeromonas caviae]
MMSKAAPNPLRKTFAPLKPALGYAAGFSIFVNLMLLGPTLFMLQVFDRVLSSRSEATLVMLSIGVAVALIAMALVDMARSRLLVETARRIDDLLGTTVLQQVVRLSSSPASSGQALSLRDVTTLRTFCSGANIIALFDAPWMIVFVIVIFLFHPAMGLLALTGALLLIALAWTTERVNRQAIEQYAEASRRSGQYIDQGLRNADTINGMGMASSFVARWEGLNHRTLDLMQTSNSRGSSLLATSKFLRQAIQSAMMGLGAWLVLDTHVTPGIMVAATILFGRAMAPVEALIGNWSALVNARSAWQRLGNLMTAIEQQGEKTALPDPLGHLQLERIALASRHPEAPILRHVEFDLPAGKSLGILGPSGAGKSSIAKIILGIWKPTTGRVCIDGAELSQWDSERLGPHLGYLTQDVELLPGTVAENIARFRSEPSEGVVEAAKRAHAYEMILKLPQGFDTLLGEGGIQLSAGQAQRVGLARALFGHPRLIILDEPNANLDAEGEQALIETLLLLKQEQVTVVMITHKPSLVATLDYLMVIRDGKTELLGPCAEVLARLSGKTHQTAAIRPIA